MVHSNHSDKRWRRSTVICGCKSLRSINKLINQLLISPDLKTSHVRTPLCRETFLDLGKLLRKVEDNNNEERFCEESSIDSEEIQIEIGAQGDCSLSTVQRTLRS